MTDERSNEEIVKDALGVPYHDETAEPETIVAALAAAGRLVTTEHDAQVWDEGAEAEFQAHLEYERTEPANPYRVEGS